MRCFLLGLLFLSLPLKAQVLEKNIANFNLEIISLQEGQRILKTLAQRRQVSALVYPDPKLLESKSQKDQLKAVADLCIQQKIIRKKLLEMGMNVTDDQVTPYIRDTRERFRFTQEQLVKFVESNGLTYDEYFEVIRTTLEFNLYMSRFIVPLINPPELEVKNEFFRRSAGKNQALSVRYNLKAFIAPLDTIKAQGGVETLAKSMKTFIESGKKDPIIDVLSVQEYKDYSLENFSKEVTDALQKTPIQDITWPLVLGDQVYVFHVLDKSTGDSEQFAKVKDQIRGELIQRDAPEILKGRLNSELEKEYIQYNL